MIPCGPSTTIARTCYGGVSIPGYSMVAAFKQAKQKDKLTTALRRAREYVAARKSLPFVKASAAIRNR